MSMPLQHILVMAVTRMLSGVCMAGFTAQPHPQSRLCWLRPVKVHDTLQLGDITDVQRRVLECFDVVELDLIKPRPQPPHCEDWAGEFVRSRPRVVRRLAGPKRDAFLAEHLDRAPEDVLIHHTRSLCLVRPATLWARFEMDAPTGKFESRVGFALEGLALPDALTRGMPVTDIRWRALGRRLLGGPGELTLDRDTLLAATGAREVYLALGLSRAYDGWLWPLAIGVHTVPDYVVTIDYANL
jgi:hypothetical protein